MSRKTQRILRLSVLVLSVAFLLTGIFSGESDTVLSKAANICLECIGIG